MSIDGSIAIERVCSRSWSGSHRISGRNIERHLMTFSGPPSRNAAPIVASTTSARVLVLISRVEFKSGPRRSALYKGFHLRPVKGLVRIYLSRPVCCAAKAKRVFDTRWSFLLER